MNHRHLLPNEIDLLLDGEVGFGVTPLRAHVDECASCESRLADARVVVDALEHLPHFAPSVRFADLVMAQVQVVEPWHAALVDTARRIVPRSSPMRVVMAASALVAASAISLSAVWLTLRADAALYVFDLAAGRARDAMVSGAGSVIAAAFGQPGLDALRSGGMGSMAVGAAIALAAAAGAAVGFRALAAASRRAGK